MTIQLEKDEYTKQWILPGSVCMKAGGGAHTSGIVRLITPYDVHDAAGFRIWRAWKDNIVGYDNSPLRRPTKSFKQIEAYWHPNTYGSKDTRYGCRRFLANWLAGDCGIEIDVMRAIMDQIPFVPETYITWTIANYDKLFCIVHNKRNPLDQLLPTYKPRTVPSPIDAIRNCVQP